MKKAIGLIALIISTSLNAQDINIPMKKLIDLAQGSENKELSNLMDIDLKIISSMPTRSDYKRIAEIISGLPRNTLGFIDSIDYFFLKKGDTLFVKIYTQDYAYQSRNCYGLGLEKYIKNDTLVLQKVYYDMKMKSIIEEYQAFNNRNFDYRIIEKRVRNTNGNTNRILISKTYHN